MEQQAQADTQWTALARRAAAGEQPALKSLCSQLLPRVRNLVRYLIRGDKEVDDYSQDAMLAILRGLSTFRGDGAFRSWADRVVARSVFANLRGPKLRLVDSGSSEDAQAAFAPDAVSRPERYLERRELAEALDAVPEAQRSVLVLHHVLGWTVGEMAVELNTPVETVRSRLRAGRQRLRDRVEHPTPPHSVLPPRPSALPDKAGHGGG